MKLHTSLDWLAELIQFDTTSNRSNLTLIDVLHHELSSLQFELRLTYNEKKDKANLFATLPAVSGNKKDGLILSGHTDVVPVKGQTWSTDPFIATKMDGRIYGRGACDMKGFIAVVLALAPYFKKLKLSKPLHLAFSFDEEVGCRGAPEIIADFKQADYSPAVCIVGEPTNMYPVSSHKGIQVFRCRIKGNAIHSSLTTKGCNSIDYAAEFICWLKNFANELCKIETHDHFYGVPYSTLSTNLIEGGNAINTVPGQTEFIFELRHLPATEPNKIFETIKKYIADELLPRMQLEFPEAAIDIESLASAPGLQSVELDAFTQLIHQLTGIETTHKVSYATEAGLFQKSGISTVVCGPGNIEQAHIADEFIEISQLQQCEMFLKKLVERVLVVESSFS